MVADRWWTVRIAGLLRFGTTSECRVHGWHFWPAGALQMSDHPVAPLPYPAGQNTVIGVPILNICRFPTGDSPTSRYGPNQITTRRSLLSSRSILQNALRSHHMASESLQDCGHTERGRECRHQGAFRCAARCGDAVCLSHSSPHHMHRP